VNWASAAGIHAAGRGAHRAGRHRAGPGPSTGATPTLVVVRPSRQWILYSLLRIGIFAAALAVLMLVGVPAWIAAITAAIIGACISYLFLRPQRDAVAKSLWEYRHTRHADVDADAEDGDDDGVASGERSEREREAQPDAVDERREAGQL